MRARAYSKVRLDRLLVDAGHAASRERAQALILAGRVLVNEQRIDKPGTSVAPDVTIRMLGGDLKYVSRGGLKLEKALEHWKIDVTGLACLDVGASTGGFTDCMLQAGARSVLAVDTGYGQIAEKFRHDERVTLRERTNARLLSEGELVSGDAANTPMFLAMDVSFISATLVLPAVVGALAWPGDRWRGEAVVLVKPQFEAGRENVGKGGIVRDPHARKYAIERVWECAASLGGIRLEVIDSPIRGMEGNHEYLACVLRGQRGRRAKRVKAVTLKQMHLAAIISKPQKPELRTILPDLIAWLAGRGYNSIVDPDSAHYIDASDPIDREEMPEQNPDLVIVLGGDGTLLSAARAFAKTTVRFSA